MCQIIATTFKIVLFYVSQILIKKIVAKVLCSMHFKLQDDFVFYRYIDFITYLNIVHNKSYVSIKSKTSYNL